MTKRADTNELPDFLNQLKRWTSFAVDESSPTGARPFILIHELKSYLNKDRLRKLLFYVQQTCSNEQVIRDNYVVVFAVLLKIGKGAYIKHFTSEDSLVDDRLPFTTSNGWTKDSSYFFEDFYEAQWPFCAKRLERGRLNDNRVPKEMVMPFKKMDVLKKGPDSTVFRVEIFPEYNYLNRDEHGNPTTNVFILKSCRSDRTKYYHNEVEAYTNLSSHPTGEDALQHIARFYGSWTQGETCNILREYVGGGTLINYFNRTESPMSKEHLLKFWENFIQIIKPIASIHHHPNPNNPHSYQQGLHNDIKPDNILVSEQYGDSLYDVSFKLSDLGLTGFVLAGNLDDEVYSRDIHGTQMYSAPEYFRGEGDSFKQQSIKQAKPSKDIWSLACVLSEAAIWSVFGAKGLIDYEKKRATQTSAISSMRNTGYSGCFHDGTKLLTAVLETHRQAIDKRRTNIDDMILQVTNIIEKMMEKKDKRPSALEVYEDFTRALDLVRPREPAAVTQSPIGRGYAAHSTHRFLPPVFPPDGLGLHLNPISTQSPNSILSITNTPENRRSLLPALGFGTIRENHRVSFPLGPTPAPDIRYGRKMHSQDGALPQGPNELTPSSRARTFSSSSSVGYGKRPMSTLHTGTPESASEPLARETDNPTASPLIPTTRQDLPYASIDTVIEWISKRKNHYTARLPDQDWLNSLHGRDQIFLIDDSKSMEEHWEQVRRVFEALAYLVKEMDPDGIELCFTNNCSQDDRSQDRRKLIKILNRISPSGQCQMGIALSRILPQYHHDQPDKRSSWRPAPVKKTGVNIYIFTDGVWSEGNECVNTMVRHIQLLVGKLVQRGQLERVGIQFIRFGDDPVGRARLEFLDNDNLQDYDVQKDIVDTEHATGNVFKMLLASTDRSWDVLHS